MSEEPTLANVVAWIEKLNSMPPFDNEPIELTQAQFAAIVQGQRPAIYPELDGSICGEFMGRRVILKPT